MRHAIIENDAPVEYHGKFAVDSEGTQHPLRPMTRKEKLAYGIYEIEHQHDVPLGYIQTGRELVLGNGVVLDQPVCKRKPKSQIIAGIKAEAHRRIVAFVPEWKQRNLLAQATLLIEKGRGNWTTTETAAWEAGEAVWAQVEAIRAASDALEEMEPLPTDFTDDSYWP